MKEAEYLLVFANEGDNPNGTLVEIGIALGADVDVTILLVGTYPWGTWRFLDEIIIHPTLHSALCAITGADHHLPIKEHLRNDPT